MSFLQRLRRDQDAPFLGEAQRSQGIRGEPEGLAISKETDDALDSSVGTTHINPGTADAGTTTVTGERAIPSVNRERSMQSRISTALALGTMLLLGGAFLLWYYTTQFTGVRDAAAAEKNAAVARAGGEMRLPPLGRVDPPYADGAASGSTMAQAKAVLGPAPPLPSQPPQTPPGNPSSPASAGPPQKSPAEMATERQLAEPVLRTRSAQTADAVTAAAAQMPSGALGMASLLGGLQGHAPLEVQSNTGLAAMLKPTPTPAVVAQLVPTRRLLLPKGSFIDCTLETAIDSTYDGMTTCVGAADVYSADGKVVLLERGTKYVGEKRGEIKQGQGRIFVLWNEARTPTGVVVNLASPGTDELGRTGLPGSIDSHFWDRFGAAILISVIDGTLQALAASQQHGSGGGTAIVLNPQGTRDIMTEVLRSTVAIPPTVVKNQGDRIQVLVARDVDFRSVYDLKTHASFQ